MVRIYFIIPIKMKWVAWFEAALYAVSVIRYAAAGLWGMALMPVVALLNLFVFFAPMFQRKASQVTARTRPQAVQFRKAVREQQKQRGYNHKCCVCGEDGRGLSGHEVSLLLQVRGLPLLLRGAHLQPRPLHRVRKRRARAGTARARPFSALAAGAPSW